MDTPTTKLPKRGDKLICVNAKENGIPIREGETYTVASSFRRYPYGAEVNEDEPGVTLEGHPDEYYLLSRFKEPA